MNHTPLIAEFSVLMSIYEKDDPHYLQQAFESISQQTLLPREFVLVVDGFISNALKKIIDDWMLHNPIEIKKICLQKNHGLGLALGKGLLHCSYDLVARMDSDDVCVSNRFEKQYKYMCSQTQISICGGYIGEFYDSIDSIRTIRRVPLSFPAISKAAKYMSPLNHVTVMFRKNDVLAAGNYRDCLLFEDYDLWVRMLMKGFQLSNIPEILVYVRTGRTMLERRRGLFLLKRWIAFNNSLRKIRFISFSYYLYSTLLHGVACLLPTKLLGFMYLFARRYRNFEV